MLITNIFASILILNTFSISNPEDPVIVVDSETQTVEEVQSESQTLLFDARQRKLSGKSGFGDHYRRAAWAADDENPDDLSLSVAILQELLSEPETIFDVFDAYRMLGQIYSGKRQWVSADGYYTQAILVAEGDPTLIDAHPRVFISTLQGGAFAKTAQGDYLGAAQNNITLRDHSCSRIPLQIRRDAALSAAHNSLLAYDEAGCIEAWQHITINFPEKLQGREGVYWQMEKAESLAKFTDNLAAELELLWAQTDIRSFDSCLHVVLALSGEWADQTENPSNTQFAYEVLAQGWDTIVENETEWITSFNGSQQRIDSLKKMTKMVLADAIMHSINLGLWIDALPLTEAYINRYGDQDDRAFSWLETVQDQLP